MDNGSNWIKWDLHVHTASSYDYKYKGEDADQLLVEALIKNEIRAVVLTDHFLIDKSRIDNIRKIVSEKGSDIKVFPGVELRTDKGHPNIHVILIFDEQSDLKILCEDFDAIIGLEKLKALHINDSLNPAGAHKDRHAKIGEGFLGLSAMGSIINHPALKDLPFCLETPNELSGYAGEIALLKTLRREPVSAEGPK